jgi:myo-inositol-1(or 4)-monophosphatase
LADASAEISRGHIIAEHGALLADAVREAGALAFSLFRTELRNWIKGASSPVCEADIAVNELLEKRLRGATPEYGWLSEESADDRGRFTHRLVWVVDPIDGTRHYIAGKEDWCVSVALVENGSPLLAALFAPVYDEFFFAARGNGASCNGKPLHATSGTALDFSRVAGPKPLVERLRRSPGDITLHPRIGSLALRLTRVADGKLDAAFAGGNSHDWDLAAADLIVHEAGGSMTALSGEAISYNRRDVTHGLLVAAGRARHAAIVERFRDHPSP